MLNLKKIHSKLYAKKRFKQTTNSAISQYSHFKKKEKYTSHRDFNTSHLYKYLRQKFLHFYPSFTHSK